MSAAANTERDRAIYAAYKAGKTRASLAIEFSLSKPRITQIVAKQQRGGRVKGKPVGPYRQDAQTHLCSRLSYIPTQIAKLEAKLAAVKAEARSYGMRVC